MNTAASFFSKLGLGQSTPTEREPAAPPPPQRAQQQPQQPAPQPQQPEGTQFDRMGGLGERVGEQMAYLASRLDELQSLRDDFASIVQPIAGFVRTHEEAQTRVLELEALLGKEREDLKALRREIVEERNNSARARSDLAATERQIGSYEEAAISRDERIRTLQSALDDSTAQAAYLAQQLAVQSDRNEALTEMADAHAKALDLAEQQLATEQARASELADSKETTAAELTRLQESLEQLTPQLLHSRRRVADLETLLQDARVAIGTLETKLATERDIRSSLEQGRAQELAAWDSERSTLTMQLDSLNARHATTSRLLEQARTLGREKSEEALRADKSAKEALEAKSMTERRLALTQDELRQSKADFAAAEAKTRDLSARCDMLERAIVAKDAQAEQANSRSSALKEQIEAMTVRFEQDHAALEAANRKLIEQLQNEKAERALAQGALGIARSSREKLLNQLAALKRQRGTLGGDPGRPLEDGDERGAIESEPESNASESNVRVFKSSDR